MSMDRKEELQKKIDEKHAELNNLRAQVETVSDEITSLELEIMKLDDPENPVFKQSYNRIITVGGKRGT